MSAIAIGAASQLVFRNALQGLNRPVTDVPGAASRSARQAQPLGLAQQAAPAALQSVRTDAQRTPATSGPATGAEISSTPPQKMPAAVVDPPEQPPLTPQEFDDLLAAWGSRDGEEGFDARFDLSGDGRINGADLGLFLLQAGGPAPQRFDQSDLQGLVDSFGARSGEERFQSQYDLNSDGRVDNSDLQEMLSRYDGPADFAELAPHLARLREAWGAQAGQEAFESAYDFNQDGQIDGADLGRLLLGARPGDEQSLPGRLEHAQTAAGLLAEAGDGLAVGAAAGAGRGAGSPSLDPNDRSAFFLPSREQRQTPITVSQRLTAETLRQSLIERLAGDA